MTKLNIYIIHDDRLKEREDNINALKQLANTFTNDNANFTIDVIIVNQHPPSSININNIKNLVKLEVLPESENQLYNHYLKKMSIESLSNTFNHVKALQTIAKHDTQDDKLFNLIIEDDVVYSDKIFKQLSVLIENLNSIEWDLLFLGQPRDNVPGQEHDQSKLQLQKLDSTDLVLHCCESYMVKAKTARDLISHMFPLKFYYNIQLSYILDKNKEQFKCAKIFPNICGDGSKTGKYNSSIMPNNVLIFNQLYKDIYMTLEKSMTTLPEEVVTDFKQKFANNPLKDNPDFLYLEALFYKKEGNLQKCKELFELALTKYESNHVPLNNSSTFLKNYIELYKFIQNISLEKN
jgi:hypothetical protein